MSLKASFSVLDLIEFDGGVIKPKPPPKEFRLFRPGLNSTKKGSFLFDAQAAVDVLAAQADHGADLTIDYDHAMAGGGFLDTMDPAERGKAAGWFNLEVRDSELWAVNAKWTPKAALAISNGEWRYVSPWIAFDPETKRISSVVNVAITNLPATDHPDPLRALSQSKLEFTLFPKALLMALGLAEDATEAVVLSKLVQLQKDAASVATLSTEIAALKVAQAKAESAKLSAEIEAAIADGRMLPAMREVLNTLGAEKPEVVRQMLSLAVKQVQMESKSTPAAPAAAPGASVTLGEFDKHVAKLTGLKPDQMLATRKMLADKGNE